VIVELNAKANDPSNRPSLPYFGVWPNIQRITQEFHKYFPLPDTDTASAAASKVTVFERRLGGESRLSLPACLRSMRQF